MGVPGSIRSTSRDPRLVFGVALVVGAIAAAVILWLVGNVAVAAGFLAAALLLAGAAWILRAGGRPEEDDVARGDWPLAHALVTTNASAVAVTGRSGRLEIANQAYESLVGGLLTPPDLPLSEQDLATLATAGRAAWRDGEAQVGEMAIGGMPYAVKIVRVGERGDHLMWRFTADVAPVRGRGLVEALAEGMGDRLGSAGIMAAVIDPDGNVIVANRVLRARATGDPDQTLSGEDLAQYLIVDADGKVCFAHEHPAPPLRLLQWPISDMAGSPLFVSLVDEQVDEAPIGNPQDVHTLLDVIPFGIALVDREGRFVEMNTAFARVAGVEPGAVPPSYPGDLVVREDKGAVADAVRRFASGAAQASDIAVRLKDHPDEPIALSIAPARGLAGASVILSFKDNGEENRLKREVAQATKMQAVGQLAGGVAHDFNNILTAIIGHCDLMLMRHSPGDSDYDDIQQIRNNSNRAASLTRQLLAFSRQQTLRPQVLQLPDVVSEVSNLLRRLMGETVTLEVKHGRQLGAVRADPGQLEQVVVNLAVNARDAMLAKSTGGKLTIITRSVPIAEIRQRGTDIMPIGDYTALEIGDTGSGIPPEVLPKIFEPFFTTKEVGKGTGLGLSTVYGIVKQSGGYIFADSKPGQGATFTIYFPVHAAGVENMPQRAPARVKPTDTWGTGTILLVEDEDMVRAIAERALARQGYTVLAAENGEAALEKMEGVDRPQLMISDVMMPVMDGPTLARAIRQRFPGIPILFMSGYAEEQLRKSIDLDNVAFLPKPFSVQQLAEAARDVLAAQMSESAAA